MKDLVIGGGKYISSKRAAELTGYTQDYIGQLARSKKISAKRVSGVWYVSKDKFSTLYKGGNNNQFIDGLSNLNKHENTNKVNIEKESSYVNNKDNITLEGTDYISSKRAAKLMGYTQDYIGQLCRNGKITARQIGRGWYIPEFVVYKNVKKNIIKEKQGISQKNTINNNIDVFTVGKKHIDKSAKNKELQEVKEINTNIQVDTIKDHKKALDTDIKKKEYYYPSFLDASYSFDNTPLIPTPKRAYKPILHEIITEGENNTEYDVKMQKLLANTTYAAQIQKDKKVKRITKDILNTTKRQELVKKSPLSLVGMTSIGVAVLLFASVVTFVPTISIFSANTGTLKTVLLFKTPKSNDLKAETATSVSKTSIIEVIIGVLSSFIEDEIIYKAK